MGVTLLFRQVPARWLFIVIPLVMGGFVGANVYSSRQMASIEDEAVSVATNGGPSIEQLSAMRGLVRDLETGTGLAIASAVEGKLVSRGFYDRAMPQLRSALSAYGEAPFYAGEREIYEQAVRETDALLVACSRTLTFLEQNRLTDARAEIRSEMHPHADRASQLLLSEINLNAREIAKSATRVVQLRPKVRATWYVLHGLAALVAALLLLLTWRAIRISERIGAERQRLAEDRAQEMEMFAGRVAHDLKNPLGAIAISVALAQRRADDPEAVRTTLKRASRAVERTQKIIDGLLAFARAGGQTRSLEHSSLQEALGGVLAEAGPQAEVAGANLELEPFGSVEVACSAGALMSVLGNLVGNAVKYIVDSPADRRHIRVRVAEDESNVKIEVEDSGPGIPPALQQRIFEPYVRDPTTRQPGIGLGLATVKRVVEGCGGSVGVRSAVGRGSCFWVELPKTTVERESASGTAPSSASVVP